MIDWLIYYCLASSEQSWLQLYTAREQVPYIKTIEKWWKGWETGSMTFECHSKGVESWIGTKHLGFCVEAAMRRLFCEVYKRGLRAASIPLCKYVTHYSQRSDFPIITWHSYVNVPPIRHPGMLRVALLVWVMGSQNKNPTKCVGLVKSSEHHYHLIISIFFCWKLE
jgi:hypothetical protein